MRLEETAADEERLMLRPLLEVLGGVGRGAKAGQVFFAGGGFPAVGVALARMPPWKTLPVVAV